MTQQVTKRLLKLVVIAVVAVAEGEAVAGTVVSPSVYENVDAPTLLAWRRFGTGRWDPHYSALIRTGSRPALSNCNAVSHDEWFSVS